MLGLLTRVLVHPAGIADQDADRQGVVGTLAWPLSVPGQILGRCRLPGTVPRAGAGNVGVGGGERAQTADLGKEFGAFRGLHLGEIESRSTGDIETLNQN